MKMRTKKILFVGAIFFGALVGVGGTWLWYLNNYVHCHCIKQAALALKIYSSDHFGNFPFSTNGFGDALLIWVKEDPSVINSICGPDDDGHIFEAALKNNSTVREDLCSRVYIQGLCETNNPDICILFDKNSCKGGDHGRSPWGPLLREVCLLDGSMEYIRDEDWPKFSRQQIELLVAAGFSRTNALHFYSSGK